MNSLKSSIITILLLLQGLELTALSPKKPQVQQKAQAAKPSNHTHTSTSSTNHTSTPAPKESEEIKNLIDGFIKDVEAITCSCGSKKNKGVKKSEEDDKELEEDKLPRCKHDKDHAEKVTKAFSSYEKLHQVSHEKGASITPDDNRKVLPHVRKIFECKNIKNMAWKPNVSSSHESSHKKTTQSLKK